MIRILLPVLIVVSCSSPAAVASASPSPTPTVRTAPPRTPTPQPATTAASSSQPPTPAVRASGQIHYVAIGASDTVGVGSADPANGSWPSRIAALLPPGSTYANLGVSGSLTAQAAREQLPGAIVQAPTVVTIWLAVNDLNAQVTPADHSVALGAIVDALVARTPAKILVGNVPDLRAVPAYSGSDQAALFAQIQAYNAGIGAVAAKHPGRTFLVDLFTGSAELTSQITVSGDGFHPSDAGYVLIAQRFAAAMRGAGIPLRPGP